MTKEKFCHVLLVGILFFTVVCGGLLSSPSLHADDAVTTTIITVPVSCTMNGTGMGTHTAQIPNGVDSRGQDYYPDGIGTTTLKAYCNDNEGFAIYAVGYSDDTIGNTYLRDNTLGQTSDILTSTTFTGNTSAWAMKIGVTNGTYTPIIAGSTSDSEKQSGDTDYSDWAAVPSTYTRVSYRNSGTDVDNNSIYTEGARVTTTYAVYISPTQKAGTYIGQVKYTLVHPASEAPLQPQPTTAGQICYYPNGNNVEGTMGCQSVSSSVTLLASNFSREGYGFAGWSDKYDYSTGANFYGPQETITLNTADYSGSNPGLSLYAVWVKSVGDLQDSSKVASLCGTGTGSLTQAPTDGTANLNSVSALTDTRDNQTYAIAKLADGNCWMIENLRLADTHQEGANTVPTTLTTLNTNNPLNDNDPTNPTVTLKHNYTDTNTFTNLSSSVAYNADTAPDGWCTSNNAACDDQSRIRADNTVNRATGNPNTDTGSMYNYGNYYNWYSATAGNGTYRKFSGEVIGDLCPNGWRLPIGDTSTGDIEQGESDSANKVGSFSYLDRKMGGTGAYQSTAEASLRWRKYPINYLYSGYVIGGSLRYRGTYGYYWSSTSSSGTYACDLYLISSYVSPGANGDEKYTGRAVRCVAQ